MKRNNYLVVILFLLSVFCAALYRVVGVNVRADGVLVESFALIPLSYLFGVAGFIVIIVEIIRRCRSKK